MNEREFLYEEDLDIEGLKPIDIPEGLDIHLLENAIIGAFEDVSYVRQGCTYEGKHYEPYRVLWVTDIPFCKKRTVFEYHNRSKKIDARGKVRIALGSFLHKFLTSKLLASGENERLFARDYSGIYLLRGKVDYILPNAVVEFKLTLRQGQLPQKPEVYYTDQLQLYLWLTERVKGYIAVINAITGEVKCYEVNKDEERINTLLEKGCEIVEGFARMKPIDPEPIYEWLCISCPVANCSHVK